MASSDKWVDAVAKMLELTQRGKLKWTSALWSPNNVLPSLSGGRETVFYATYKGKRLRLRELNFNSVASIAVGAKISSPTSSVILEFVDSNGAGIWQFPPVKPLRDLLHAVQYQVAGVNEFLDEILGEE